MKRNERRKTLREKSTLTDSARIAGTGISEDNYSEDSGRPDYERRYRGKNWNTGTTEEDRMPGEVIIIREADK